MNAGMSLGRRQFLHLGGAAALSAAGIRAGSPARASTTLEQARESGVLRVGYFQAPPLSFDPGTAQPAGYSPDLARHIAQQNGIPTLEGYLFEFEGLIPGLLGNRFDVITCAMTIKPERCEIVAFSNPGSRFMATIAVKKGNPLALLSYSDIAERSEARLGGVAATYELQLARIAGVPESRIVQFPNDDAMISGLVGGRIDAATSVGPMLVAMLDKKRDPSIEMVYDFQVPTDANGNPAVSFGGFAFRKGETDLIDMFNAGIADAITSGWRLENLKKYGLGESSLPGEMRTAEICSAA